MSVKEELFKEAVELFKAVYPVRVSAAYEAGEDAPSIESGIQECYGAADKARMLIAEKGPFVS